MSLNNWIRLVPARRPPQLRFVGFPHAGGSASFFRSWATHLPEGVELAAACYPGREDRIGEPLPTRMADLAAPLAMACANLSDRPMVFFGHSMGASGAYETVLRVARDYGIDVLARCGSGRAAPGHERVREPVPDDDDALAREVIRLGGSESAVLDGELRELVLPVVRADYGLTARYDNDHSTTPVATPITAYYGLADEDLQGHSVQVWPGFTEAGFSLRAMPGSHFYLSDDPARLVSNIFAQAGDRTTRYRRAPVI